MDLPPPIRAMLDTACAQRNQAADAVVELNGRLAQATQEVYTLREQLAEALAQVESLRARDAAER